MDWMHTFLVEQQVTPVFPLDATGGITDLGMMGNDRWGNCAQCGEVHNEMTTACIAGATGPAPDSPLAVTRYVKFAPAPTPPGPPGPGTDLADYLHELWLAGIILAWGPVNHRDRAGCQKLMAAGFSLYVGVNLYDANEDQFSNGQPFDVTPGEQPDPEDGHCVLWSKSESADTTDLSAVYDYVGTWGVWWPVTLAWMLDCLHNNPNGEAYVIVTTEEQLAKFTPELLAVLNTLQGNEGGKPAPVTPPSPPVPPTPPPVTPPSPVPVDPPPPGPGPVPAPPLPPDVESELEKLAHDAINAIVRLVKRYVPGFSHPVDPEE